MRVSVEVNFFPDKIVPVTPTQIYDITSGNIKKIISYTVVVFSGIAIV